MTPIAEIIAAHRLCFANCSCGDWSADRRKGQPTIRKQHAEHVANIIGESAQNACDVCTYPLAGNGGGLCCTCAARFERQAEDAGLPCTCPRGCEVHL